MHVRIPCVDEKTGGQTNEIKRSKKNRTGTKCSLCKRPERKEEKTNSLSATHTHTHKHKKQTNKPKKRGR